MPTSTPPLPHPILDRLASSLQQSCHNSYKNDAIGQNGAVVDDDDEDEDDDDDDVDFQVKFKKNISLQNNERE